MPLEKKRDKADWLALYHLPPPKKKDPKTKAKSVKTAKKAASATVLASQQDDMWVCEICGEDFRGTEDKVVECSGCASHYCASCVFLEDAEYEFLKRPEISWECPSCKTKEKTGEDKAWLITNIEEKIDSSLQSLEKKLISKINLLQSSHDEVQKAGLSLDTVSTKIDQLEEKMEDRLVNIQKSQEEAPAKLKNTWANITAKAPLNNSPESFRGIMQETLAEQRKQEKDKANWEGNLIIYRVQESEAENVEETIIEDTKFFRNLCSEALGIEELKIIEVRRLGKKDEGESRSPRPLLVTLANKTDKGMVFRNMSKLQAAEEKYKQVSITNDYSKDERAEIKQKVAEAKEQEKADQSKNWIYRVRGSPGNLKIVKIKRSQ